MNTLRKSRINLLLLLIYLVTLQVSTGSAFYSICISVVHGMTYISEQLPKTNQKPQVTIRKHLNVNHNEKNSASSALITPTSSIPELREFAILRVNSKLDLTDQITFDRLKDRAPPQIS
ncbi:MAG: hypothetical protein ACM34K_00445 [Bacillota bacterium]